MPDPQKHDSAVAFCVDRNYYPFAMFMIWQIAHHNPRRKFDFVIVSRDDLVVPDWALPLGIVFHRAGDLPEAADAARQLPKMARFRGSMNPLDRIMLARDLGDRYCRILSLDCDMFVDGGDFNRLLAMDIGAHPIGAVLDAPFLYERNHHAKEYQLAGFQPAPYANSGLQVIDTKAYREQEVARRSLEVFKTHPDAIFYTDQSLINLALRGKFAQLAPCWNWQNSIRLPLVTQTYPVFLRHFIGSRKPDRTSNRTLEPRFNLAYREFLTQFFPEILPKLAPPPPAAPLTPRELFITVIEHVLARTHASALLARYPDPYVALI